MNDLFFSRLDPRKLDRSFFEQQIKSVTEITKVPHWYYHDSSMNRARFKIGQWTISVVRGEFSNSDHQNFEIMLLEGDDFEVECLDDPLTCDEPNRHVEVEDLVRVIELMKVDSKWMAPMNISNN